MTILKNISQTKLVLLVCVFLFVFCNTQFFEKLITVYPPTLVNIPFLIAISTVLISLTVILLGLFSTKYTVKPLLIFILICSSFSAYFMNQYGIVIDQAMLQNTFETNTAEFYELINIKLFITVLFLGILPSYLVYKCEIEKTTFKKAFINKAKLLSVTVLIFVFTIWLFSSFFSGFIREHKDIRAYSNPLFFIDSSSKYIYNNYIKSDFKFKKIGVNAKIPDGDKARELVIMVVGETARADRFSLNGYTRKTNPLLENEGVFYFSNFSASGTSTAVSVPCMFSVLNGSDCNKQANAASENLLDVLRHADINVLWRDNNSSSKGVADRVDYQDFKTKLLNPDCDRECRDLGMLSGLDSYIKYTKKGDIFIVLHQMGSHGPAYYKRYPVEFEKFTPVCKTAQLNNCTDEEINNAYDNTILYTDYFLAEVIKFLKNYSSEFETVMLYVSDHGESLGEKGLYLHGMPYSMAPKEQIQIPAIMWFGDSYHVNRNTMQERVSLEYSHDNIFHTALGIVEVYSEPYNSHLDILSISVE